VGGDLLRLGPGGVIPIDRRELLRLAALAGAGLPIARRAAAESEPPRVRRSVVLGRTGLHVPDIGFGASRLRGDTALVHHALERGITHFDTAEGYTDGDSETTLGRALRGRREQVTLTSKVEAGADESAASLMRRLEASLLRLQTEWVDFYLNHAVNEPARITSPEWAEFTQRAKQQGKIRWRGMSGHAGRLVECLDAALDRDLVDVVLVAFNFGQDPAFHERLTKSFDMVAVQPELPRVLARAKAKGVGIVAMKTLRGARLNDMRPFETGGATFAQAAFRWVLSQPFADSLVVTMGSPSQVDEYLGASGWTRLRAGDLGLLAAYERANGATQCRYGCDACASSCPKGVPISDVLRARMYAADYGDLELGRETYAALGAGAQDCLSCAERSCVCPHGLPIAELTRPAHELLAG
jgi:predicted aldo/keto reductase-like oxidoreductase